MHDEMSREYGEALEADVYYLPPAPEGRHTPSLQPAAYAAVLAARDLLWAEVLRLRAAADVANDEHERILAEAGIDPTGEDDDITPRQREAERDAEDLGRHAIDLESDADAVEEAIAALDELLLWEDVVEDAR